MIQDLILGLKMLLHDSFLPLVDEMKLAMGDCIDSIEPPAFQLGNDRVNLGAIFFNAFLVR